MISGSTVRASSSRLTQDGEVRYKSAQVNSQKLCPVSDFIRGLLSGYLDMLVCFQCWEPPIVF